MSNIDKYQELARQFRLENCKTPYYAVLGLTSEAGEVADWFKKSIRGDIVDRDDLILELGDVLWYLSAIADDLEIDLSLVAEANINKLTARKEMGTIKKDNRIEKLRKGSK